MDDRAIAEVLRDRGGSAQRMALSAAEDPDDVPMDGGDICDLAEALLYLFGWGTLSLPNINWLARSAIKAGASHPELTVLAEMGGGGKFPNNMRRDMFRHFLKGAKVPRPLAIQNVFAMDNAHHLVEVEQSIISLNELLESVYTNYVTYFDLMMGESPREFWEQVRPDDPRLPSMADITRHEGWMDTTYPCILHGDGGVYTRKTESSVLVVSVKSMLSQRFGDDIIPGIVLPKHLRATTKNDGIDTAEELWRAYIHQLNAAYLGEHAATDHRGNDWPDGSPQSVLAGTPLCEGKVRVVIFLITGDLEYFGNELWYPHFNSNKPCWFCPVARPTSSQHQVLDFSRRASFKGFLYTIADHFSQPVTTHPIAELVNICRLFKPW